MMARCLLGVTDDGARPPEGEREREIAHEDSGENKMAKYKCEDCRRRMLERNINNEKNSYPRLPTEFELKTSRLGKGRNTAGSDEEKLKHEKEESE